MVTFVLLAAALTVAGVIAVVIPLLRGAGASAPGPAPWAAVAATVLLVIGSACCMSAGATGRGEP